MTKQDITLNDRFDLGKDRVLLNGTQALVRLMLMQKARDRAAGARLAVASMANNNRPGRQVFLPTGVRRTFSRNASTSWVAL